MLIIIIIRFNKFAEVKLNHCKKQQQINALMENKQMKED